MRLLGLGALYFFLLTSPALAVEVVLSCGATGQELTLCREGAEAWAKDTGHSVTLISTPSNSSERLALYQQLLAAHDSAIDVFQIDVIWPGILHHHFIDLKPYVSEDVLKSHFPAIIANNTVDGQLIAMPWFTDAGVLYYRRDLLKKYNRAVPLTWEEMAETARIVQEGERKAGNKKFWGYVWQGRAYEGLTCDALEWIASFGGGSVVESDGSISINNPKAIQAIETAASWVTTISPKGVLNYSEEEARGVFQSGNAAFMRNWPYAWNLVQSDDSPVKGKVAVTMLPTGYDYGKHAATLGGWQLSISKYSAHPKEAAELVLYLTSAAEQKRRAIAGAYNPTIMALYQDSQILKAVPFFGSLYEVFVNAVARPSSVTGKKYNQVSSAFWNSVHEVLSGEQDATISLQALETRLTRISRNGQWGKHGQ